MTNQGNSLKQIRLRRDLKVKEESQDLITIGSYHIFSSVGKHLWFSGKLCIVQGTLFQFIWFQSFITFEVFYNSVCCKELMTIMQMILLYEHGNDFYPKEERGRPLTKKNPKKPRSQFASICKSNSQYLRFEICLCLDLL